LLARSQDLSYFPLSLPLLIKFMPGLAGAYETGLEPPMIVAKDLTRKYGDFTAVENVSFEIPDGQVVGLLGHNGAGKTTIMKMMTGFLEPTSGSVAIDGHDVETDRRAAQGLIGYLPENCPLYPEMTVIDFLDYAAELRGVPQEQRPHCLRAAIAATELGEKATAPIASLSRGFRQRVGVAQAILHRPKIIILDEPTNGLDPTQIGHMRALIKRLAENATVMLSTHILQEIQAVADRVIVIHRGRKALDSSLADLRKGGRLRLVTSGAPDVVEPLLKGLDMVHGFERLAPPGHGHAYGIKLNGDGPEVVAPKVARAINEKGLDLFALAPEQRDLETVFAEITTADHAGGAHV
jgi:ABC-2 type transport system ATP-binding protein